MNREDIIEAASKAGFETKLDMIWVDQWEITPALTRFAALVAAAERERIIAANAPEIERINAHIKELEQARLEEREACARVCESVIEEIRETADNVLSHEDCRSIQAAQDCVAAIRAQAADRLARHGINPCPDCHGVGYDASGQLCWCQQNPSF